MDVGEMRELLRGYLDELDWGGGVSKEDVTTHLTGRDDALWSLVSEYIPDGAYHAPEELLTLVPEQAWQDAQGDAWRGTRIGLTDESAGAFREGPVG